jgi:hypothetical protein
MKSGSRFADAGQPESRPFERPVAECVQEIDRRDLRDPPLQPRKLGIGPSSFLTADRRT